MLLYRGFITIYNTGGWLGLKKIKGLAFNFIILKSKFQMPNSVFVVYYLL